MFYSVTSVILLFLWSCIITKFLKIGTYDISGFISISLGKAPKFFFVGLCKAVICFSNYYNETYTPVFRAHSKYISYTFTPNAKYNLCILCKRPLKSYETNIKNFKEST